MGGAWGTLAGFGDPCGGGTGWVGDGGTAPFVLRFGGVDERVEFGHELSMPTWTITAWVRVAPGGVAASTGTGGINLIPLVARGAAENEDDLLDITFVLGVTPALQLGTDFEEQGTHANLPFSGAALLEEGVWAHVAATKSAEQRALYVRGVLDVDEAQTATPAAAPDSLLTVGAMRRTTGALLGRFAGDIAALETYDRALSADEVRASCAARVVRFDGAVCEGP